MHLSELWDRLPPGGKFGLARKVDSHPAYLWQIAHGRRQPSPDMARRLVAADRRLTLSKLRPDLWGRAPAAKRTR